MTAVLPYRVDVSTSDIRSGAAVRGPTWYGVAQLNNHTLGRGGMLVPAYSPGVALTAGTTYLLAYWVLPRYQALERCWQILGRGATATNTLAIEAPAGVTARDAVAYTEEEDIQPVRFIETIGAQSEAEAELELELTPTSGGSNVNLDSVCCYEVPRAALAIGDSGDRGHGLVDTLPGQLIDAGAISPAVATLYNDQAIGRRVSLVQWAVPYSAGGSTTTSFAASTTSSSYQDLWDDGIPVLARQLDRSATTGAIVARFLAWTDGTGTGGEIRLSSSVHGASSTASVSNSVTSPTWTDPVVLEVDCTDLTAADGRRSSAWDELQVQYKADGTTTLYLASASVYEATVSKGESGFSASNYYTLADGNLEGSETMTRVVVFRYDSAASATGYLISKGFSNAWSFFVDTSDNLTFRASGASSPTHTLTVGKTYVAVGTYDGANVRLYVNGAQAGSGTANTGYSPSSLATTIGAFPGATSPADFATIIAAAASDTTVMAESAAAYYAHAQALGDVAPFAGVEWLVSKKHGGDLATDLIGSLNMTAAGTTTAEGPFLPEYG